MSDLVLPMPGNEALAGRLERALGGEGLPATFRRFPDEEIYVRVDGEVAGRDVVVACTLARPDEKLVPLCFALQLLRELGARSVGLVAPYLPYMRQDARFQSGEAVTSRSLGRLLSQHVDWIVTVDPHLHRHVGLDELFSIPAVAVHAAPLVGGWIGANVEKPVLVGPDSESEQWVVAVAAAAGAPHVVLAKKRRGDRDVEVSVPDGTGWGDRTPVVVDDIISTGGTMAATVAQLRRASRPPPTCIAIHAVFASGALEALREAGAGRIVTCDTVPHETNAVDLTPLLVDGITRARRV